METVVLNNTEYDVLVEEEARLIRLVFYDIDDDDNGYDGDDIGDNESTCDYDNNDDNDDDDNDDDDHSDWRRPSCTLTTVTSATSESNGLSWSGSSSPP